MLYSKVRKDALAIHEKAVRKYNDVYSDVTKNCNTLYDKRVESTEMISDISTLINSIANSPKEFAQNLVRIEKEQMKFRQTQEYAAEAYDATLKSGTSAAAGIAGGTAIASLGPTAAMWVATTFGTASTGTAISSLSGAVATKAALAWLGGGALSAGGAGVAGGKALLALAGPLGWGIAGASTVASAAILGFKNKRISSEAVEEAKKITVAGAMLNESNAKITNLISETKSLLRKVDQSYAGLIRFKGADYSTLEENDQIRLGSLVNNTLSLAELLNKTVEEDEV